MHKHQIRVKPRACQSSPTIEKFNESMADRHESSLFSFHGFVMW